MLNAMIFAAGLGTRLQSLTKEKPKALVELNGVPLLERAIKKLIALKVDRIVINVHHYADQIEQFLLENHNFGADIRISDERTELLDTGGGLLKAKDLFLPNAPILIYNVDVFSSLDLNQLLVEHKQSNSLVSIVMRDRETQRYLCFDDKNQLTGWKNIKTGETKIAREGFETSTAYAFSGIHVVDSRVFDLTQREGKFSIIDLYLELAKENRIKAFVDDSKVWIDLGKPENLELAKSYLKK